MANRSESNHTHGRPKSELSVRIAGQRVPKLPHEHDESVEPRGADPSRPLQIRNPPSPRGISNQVEARLRKVLTIADVAGHGRDGGLGRGVGNGYRWAV